MDPDFLEQLLDLPEAQTGSDGGTYIWLTRWRDFQHYRPDPNRVPAWIKSYTSQLNDERYLLLSDRQRSLLHDLRHVFAMTRGRLRCDASTISRYRQRQTRHDDLKALNHAGLVEFISRVTLEQRLEQLYNGSSPEVEVDKEPLYPRRSGDKKSVDNPKTKDTKARRHANLLAAAIGAADHWNGTDTASFEEALDQLEQDQQSRLSILERDNLWNERSNQPPYPNDHPHH